MAFEAKLSLRQMQKMVMTPMLQQAIHLLQLSRMELLQAVRQEVEQNPVLEELIEGVEEPDEASALKTVAEEPTTERNGEGDTAEIDWDSYLQDASDYRPTIQYESIERFDSENLLTRSNSLQDHLLFQLHLTVRDDELLKLGSLIIGELDDNGYLRSSLDELAPLVSAPLESMESALQLIQSFDPAGVGARDLRECLLIQLRIGPKEHALAESIVNSYLPDLERHRFAKIAAALGASLREVQEAMTLIASLEPKPGKNYSSEEPQYITPDVYILKIDGRLLVALNEDGLPRLRVSRYYRQILSKQALASREAKGYVEEKMRSALWFIRSIEQRKRTLIKVAESLVKYQREFFEYGLSHLKPLTLREVADDISMHESTISRVTTNKYVQTPQGLFGLKYFFHRGVPSTVGEVVSSRRVRDLVRRYLTEEDSSKPLSDQKIVEILAKVHGVEIARRTVAKYRGQLKIPSSNQRRYV
ncbi:RNA polymerase sigma-54 factor [Candidatus Methylomirabilis oxygeniifera]|uniref:RNA polymerase sigma-54 factor n=1 Tax=Methylomirabilis oxygeniifera TaxID=671143 RepID=D5MES1_METO1|nr:RNA polymerase sigma-54 factor [Candidatus Methylomirabilis oxyfera]